MRNVPARIPGRVLVELADWLFREPGLSTVVLPAIADMQQEIHEAGENRRRRAAARIRGYAAFWRLVVLAPLVMPGRAVSGASSPLASAWSGLSPVPLLVGALCAAIWPIFGPFVLVVLAGGLVLAAVLRRRHDHEPMPLAPEHPLASLPAAEINLSSIPVAGNVGGLFFVVGSVVIVLLGLPAVRWFAAGALVAAGLLASGLFAWRETHRETPHSILGLRDGDRRRAHAPDRS